MAPSTKFVKRFT